MFVIGTAGHIDHGKSVLIHKLTGIDPDRLIEEKERGMTIDLGFAWLTLPSGREVGIVDVPGHERFIKNMLAGVGGIDLALLVVAANEGVMPQTREHLDILNLLDIQTGVVVITKIDTVDEELLSLVIMEVQELIATTSLHNAPILPVSAYTGEGLKELVATIDELLSSIQPRKDIGRPRLLIDRVFTIAGSGTVVTGTLIDGSLSQGQEVEVVPAGLKARVRGLQSHKTRVETAGPGSRVAANITGVSVAQLQRGDVLTSPGWLLPATRVDVKLRLLDGLPRSLKHGATVSFFPGAAEELAKVHLLEKEEVKPGETALAQLALKRPVAAVKGDHYIIRSPMDTLGGGNIISVHARRHRRFRENIVDSLSKIERGTAEEILEAMLEMKQPLELRSMVIDSNLSEGEVEKALAALEQQKKVRIIGRAGDRIVFSSAGWDTMVKKSQKVVGDYCKKFTTRAGLPKGELSSKLGLTPQSPVLQKLKDDNIIVEEGATVRLPEFQVKLTEQQQKKIDAFLRVLKDNPYSPPGDVTLEPELLNLIIRQGKAVKVAEGVVFSKNAYDEMVGKIIAYAKEHGSITIADVREMFGNSRKYITALLEYMDDKKLTRRVGDARVVK
ncbi:MAG: selenocysteine-specific translation elongation factor [Dehalococcoidia bacterium]